MPAPLQERNDRFYRELLARTGRLDVSDVSRRLRYESVCRAVDLHGRHLLDLGCGQGGFAAYLATSRVLPSAYEAIDPLPECVHAFAATMPAALPTVPWRAEVSDYLADRSNRPCDVAVAIGTFDLALAADPVHNLTCVFDVVAKLVEDARQAVCCTFRSSYQVGGVRPGSPEALFDPAVAHALAKKLVRRVLVDDSYAPHLFTLTLYKGHSDWETLSQNFYPLPDWSRGRERGLAL